MTTELTPEEYEKLYEDGLWRHRQALQAYQQCTTATELEAAAQLVVERANLDGILRQQACAKNAPAEVREAAQALQQIWRRTHPDSKWQPAKENHNRQSISSLFQGSVDDFFELYPECMQQNASESDEESSSSEEEEVRKQHAQKRLDQKQQSQQQETIMDVDAPIPTNPPPAAARQTVNPYVQKSTTNRLVNPYARKARSTYEAPGPDYSAAWEDHQRQNPFQTAREFSVAEQQQQQRGKQYQQQQQPQYQHQQQQQYHQQQWDDEPPLSESYDPPAPPAIPESLRRKYRPPVKQAPTAVNKSTGQVQKKPASKKDNAEGDDDDDLPPELQRFGKELVQKIENEIMDGGDRVTFDDIAGLAAAKQTIQEVICWPMQRPDLFTGLRKAPNGLLLYGPPGTGKTLIGKAIAHESGATFFSISSSSLTSKWIGEGEKLVRTMFAVAAYREPSVVFIDEIDSLLTQRKSDENEASRRIKTEFLVQLDGTGTTAQGRVLTIGATNRPQELDEAARRRFVKRLYIPLPVEADRAILLHVLLGKNKHRLTDEDVKKLAKETEGFSGADLKALCTDAAMGPIRKLGARALQVEAADVPPISYKHFRQSLKSMKPSVAPADLLQYEEWDQTYGSKRVEEEAEDDSSSDEE